MAVKKVINSIKIIGYLENRRGQCKHSVYAQLGECLGGAHVDVLKFDAGLDQGSLELFAFGAGFGGINFADHGKTPKKIWSVTTELQEFDFLFSCWSPDLHAAAETLPPYSTSE